MPSLRFHIRFPEDKIKEPIVYQIGREYKVVTNVRRADVRETTGWSDAEWARHRIAAVDRAYQHFVDGVVLSPLLDDFLRLAEERERAAGERRERRTAPG